MLFRLYQTLSSGFLIPHVSKAEQNFGSLPFMERFALDVFL